METAGDPDPPQPEHFLAFLTHVPRLTTMLNEMSRSMGQSDFYPFVLPREVVGKLHFIHLVVISRNQVQLRRQDHAQMQMQMQMQSSGFRASA